MFEKHKQPLVPTSEFIVRLVHCVLFGFILIIVAMGVGMLGYHFFEDMSWPDAFVNAAMILSGMGPVTALNTVGGKVFAGFYALFSGLAFIIIMGVILAPIFHRFFHKFHLDTD